ncbi:MAG: 50S ribosomal protein L22 [Solirubrobacterales bacterium]
MAERKKGTKPQRGAAESAPDQERSTETPAKRGAESKPGEGGGGSTQAKKAESKGRAGAQKKAESGAKSEPAKKPAASKAPAKTKESAPKSKAPAKAKESASKSKAPAKAKVEGESKPAAKQRAKREAPERPVVNARARFVRVAPRKARLVADQVRGMPVEDALALLRFHPRTASRDIAKLLDSAAANAEANHDLVADELRIADIVVDEGPTLRRYRPRALGRATKINKRTSHIKVALTPED